MAKLLGLDKVGNFLRILKHNGGIKGSLMKLWKQDDIKFGLHVGTDNYGNKYFENNMYFYGRNRWVEYAPEKNWDYDGSQVPPEWHNWLHYITDNLPSEVPPVHYKWMIDHQENVSGTSKAYMPYSTTKPKVLPWQPKHLRI